MFVLVKNIGVFVKCKTKYNITVWVSIASTIMIHAAGLS